MQKTKTYTRTRFPAEVVREAALELTRRYGDEKTPSKYLTLSVEHDESEWQYDALEEFLADYRIYRNDATLQLSVGVGALVVRARPTYMRVNVQANSRSDQWGQDQWGQTPLIEKSTIWLICIDNVLPKNGRSRDD